MFSDLPFPALMMLVLGGLALVGYVVISVTNAYVSRMGGTKTDAPLPPDFPERFRRMEHTLDSLSLEMERLSEAQRYTAKLLADSTSRPPALPRPER